jgi:RHS repeat-associated protein
MSLQYPLTPASALSDVSVVTLPPWYVGTDAPPDLPRSYFGARYNQGQVGRLTTADPVAVTGLRLLDPQRLNRYAYARNNPLRYVDPNGRDLITYDEYGNESSRVKQSKWHNFWVGHSYNLTTSSGQNYRLGSALTPLTGGRKYEVVGATQTAGLVDSFLSAQIPNGEEGGTLSYPEIARRAVGPWNWKVELNRDFGPNALFVLDGTAQRSDYLGNFAFGYLMNAWGRSVFEAQWGGAAFNLYSSFESGANPFKGSLFTGYDDPRDFEAIRNGAASYRQRGR